MTGQLSHETGYDSRPRAADAALRRRAAAVIPGGMYGHQSARPLPPEYPQFMRAGLGARIWDVDGNSYVDLMCSYGPIVLGHRHPAVEAAVRAQAALADCQNGPGEVMVELAELLVATVQHADWAIFAKNGTDATTMCCTIARAHTGRRRILVARGAYHGAAPWCTPRPAGVTPEDRVNLGYYTYNDLASVAAAMAEAGGDVAGVVVSPFRHDAGFDQELADPEFARGLRALCTQAGAALILDDVRCGFRLHLGSSWEPIGVLPDLSAWSKAIANGHPLAAVLGSGPFRDAAASIFVTGSFWFSAAAMAAAVATIGALRDENAIEAMDRAGTALRAGILAQAAERGLPIRYTGPAAMPYLTFVGDRAHSLASVFAAAAAVLGMIALIGFTVAIPDLKTVEASSLPLLTIAGYWLPSWLVKVFVAFVIFSMFAILVVGAGAQARLAYSLARDNMLPFSGSLRKVNMRTQTPIVALLVFAVIDVGVTWYGYLQASAFATLVGATAIIPYIIYFLITAGYAHKRRTLDSIPGAFSLGRWAWPVIVFVLLYSALIIVVLSVPGPFHAADKVVLYGAGVAVVWYFAVLLWRLRRGTAGVRPVEDLVD